MNTGESAAALKSAQARYQRLRARLARLGPILQGTITARTIARPDPDGGGGEKRYGPYYQWTFKQAGKTVTVNLTAARAKRFQRAIEQHRILEETLNEMRELARRILEAATPGVKRRNR